MQSSRLFHLDGIGLIYFESIPMGFDINNIKSPLPVITSVLGKTFVSIRRNPKLSKEGGYPYELLLHRNYYKKADKKSIVHICGAILNVAHRYIYLDQLEPSNWVSGIEKPYYEIDPQPIRLKTPPPRKILRRVGRLQKYLLLPAVLLRPVVQYLFT